MDFTSNIEDVIFQFMDRCKFLFFPEQWNQVFLDFSKNEAFALLLLYRRKHMNMTEVSEYLNVPLNTITGVVNRLEKKGMVARERCKEDKRIVTILLTELGQQFLKDEMDLMALYFYRVMEVLTEEEKNMLFNVMEKVFQILSQDIHSNADGQGQKKKVRKITIE